jgi:elongation factor P hydroxylase
MQIDLEYLRRQYSLLSDEALLAVKRADLVELARKCYDDELDRRKIQAEGELSDAGDEPLWLSEAAQVYSRIDHSGTLHAKDVADVSSVLEAAGIPCYAQFGELPPDEPNSSPSPTHQWRIMVPGNLNLQATSVLERDIYNQEFEADWKAHLEELSDEEVLLLTPETVFCGLFDRIERVTKAYAEEIARRGL